MNKFAQWLQQIWYRNRVPPWPLRMLAGIYAFSLELRPAVKPAPQQLPLLVIGNLVAGGSGKTPLVLHLARLLQQAGWRVAVIARVYQGSARGVRVLDDNSSAMQVGDEPMLLHQSLDCPVVVSSKRRYAYDYVVKNMRDIQLVISDDGLQHRHFQASISIGVVSARRGLGNGRLLPAGPLREPWQRFNALDYLVVKSDQAISTEAPVSLPGWPGALPATAISMKLAITHARRLHDGKAVALDTFAQQEVQAVAAIADPGSFFAMLCAQGLQVHDHALPDHSHIPDSLWQQLPRQQPLLVTSKDAVKISADRIHGGDIDIWEVPLQTELPQQFLDNLLQHCRQQICRAA